MGNLKQFVNNQNPKGSPAGNLEMINQFRDFARNYHGNPQQAVMQMLQNGQINNQQLQQAMEQAKQLQRFLR